MEGERLARIESKQDHILYLIENHIRDQKEKNDVFFDVRDKVLALRSNANFGWKLICAFGAVTVSVSTAVAWLATHIKLKLMGM